MPLTATLFIDDPDERRVSPRRPVGQQTTLRRSGMPIDAILHDLSSSGASIETMAPLTEGAAITVGLPGVGRVAATVVSAASPRFGCRFDHALSPDALGRAFAGEPVVVGSFALESRLAGSVGFSDEKFSGPVRLALPIGGAVIGWALIVQAVRVMLG